MSPVDYATRPLGRCVGCGQKGRWEFVSAIAGRVWRCVPCGRVVEASR